MGAAGPTWWFRDGEKTAATAAACAGEPEWLSDEDVILDEEDEAPTVPDWGPRIGPGKPADVVSTLRDSIPPPCAGVSLEPPGSLGNLVLRAVLVASGVAIMILLGWWGGTQGDAPSGPEPAATSQR